MEKVIEESRLNLIYLNLIQNFLSDQTLLNQETQLNLIEFLSFSQTSNSSKLIQNLIHTLLNSNSILIEKIEIEELNEFKRVENFLYKVKFVHQVFYESYLNRSKKSECLHQSNLNRFLDQCTFHHHPLLHLHQSLINLVLHAGIYNAIINTNIKPDLILIRFLDRLEELLNSFEKFNQVEECSIIWIVSQVFPFILIKDLNRINQSNQTRLIKMFSSEIEKIIITQDFQDHQHPLFEKLGPISISFGILLRSIGLKDLTLVLTSLDSIHHQLSTLNLNESLASSKPIMFSVLGILIGPVYLTSHYDLMILCLKLWLRIFDSVQKFGKSQIDLLVWDGIINGIKGLSNEEFVRLIRWLEPWNGSEEGKKSDLLVYLSVLENGMERLDDLYLEENVVEKVWKEVEIRVDDHPKSDHDHLRFESAWRVLISIVRYRKLREDDQQIVKFVDRMMDSVLSSKTNEDDDQKGKMKEELKKESIKVMTQTLNEKICWDHLIERIRRERDCDKMIEVLKYIDNQDQFIKICEVLNQMVLKIDDETEKYRVLKDWFEVVSESGCVEPVRWWIDQIGGSGVKALSKL
ncbi:hypothetical protein DFH28DRAFT_1215725 [Melampsora americana]|nr:hypothetical protein DFH28DRAFT_1215725 [Melampsora americana]